MAATVYESPAIMCALQFLHAAYVLRYLLQALLLVCTRVMGAFVVLVTYTCVASVHVCVGASYVKFTCVHTYMYVSVATCISLCACVRA